MVKKTLQEMYILFHVYYIIFRTDTGTLIEIICIHTVKDPYTVILLCQAIWDLVGSLLGISGADVVAESCFTLGSFR